MDTYATTAAIYTALLVIAGGLGLYWLGGGVRRVGRRQVVRGTVRSLCGCCVLLFALLLASLGLNLRLYHRFTAEQTLADVSFAQIDTQYYTAYIQYPDGTHREVNLRGDAWQLDARVLKWQGMATVLGMDPLYKLERISGRYQDLAQERSAERSVWALSEEPKINLLALAQQHPDWLPWVDATYGSAAYVPMADQAQYQVSLSTTGLIIRPTNTVAEQAVQDWR